MISYHFTINRGWLGDPNGLIYYNGMYHMFYQLEPKHNTFTPNMHWGHANSKDLINWVNLPIALSPDNLGAIWSGSSVVDRSNTSGFGENSLICIYTSAGGETYESSDEKFTISLAYSTDGVTFNKYQNNPIVGNIARGNRDPKVFWYHDKWIMIMFLNNNLGFQFLHSSDLLDWTKLCTVYIEGISDCPDIMHLVNDKFLFFGTNGKYVVGTFDGNKFIIESVRSTRSTCDLATRSVLHQFAYGETYSSQTWSNEPNNKHIMIFRLGDMENSNHISQMSIPLQLSYDDKLVVEPLQSIIDDFTKNSVSVYLSDVFIESKQITLNTCQFYLDIHLQNIDSLSIIELIDGIITYDKNTFSYNTFDFSLCDNEITLQIVSDLNSIEIFVNKEKYIGCFQYGNAYESIKFNNVHIKKLLLYQSL